MNSASLNMFLRSWMTPVQNVIEGIQVSDGGALRRQGLLKVLPGAGEEQDEGR